MSENDSIVSYVTYRPAKFTGELVFDNRRFNPKPDITPLENAKLMQFWLCLLVPTWGMEGHWEWLAENNLDRHFDKPQCADTQAVNAESWRDREPML